MTAQPQMVTAVDELAEKIALLSHAEKAELLQRLATQIARDVPGIVKTPGVVGGRAAVDGTRIPVWILVGYRQLGLNDERLLESYPSLRLSDLQNAWKYYDLNRDEIDRDIYENEHDEDDDEAH